MVDPNALGDLVGRLPDGAFARYPSLSPKAVRRAVEEFVGEYG